MGTVSFNVGSFINANNAPGMQAGGNGKGIFAGNAQFGAKSNPLIDQKKQLAGKKAMKLITDAFDRDQKYSDSVNELKEKKAAITKELNETKSQLKSIDDEKTALQEQYGIDPDSQEQKDLELLQKYQNAKNGVEYSSFSDEEKERLKELEGTNRTEYQSRMLELNGQQGDLKIQGKKLEGQIMGLTSSISDMQVDQLKSQDMLNANEAAEGIMDAASKEIVGMLVNDAKEAMEEKAEEAKEQGEKFAEAREKFEERLEESKEKRKEEQEIIENAHKAELEKQDIEAKTSDNSAVAKAHQDIQQILADNNMLDEDIKGLKIDLGF